MKETSVDLSVSMKISYFKIIVLIELIMTNVAMYIHHDTLLLVCSEDILNRTSGMLSLFHPYNSTVQRFNAVHALYH